MSRMATVNQYREFAMKDSYGPEVPLCEELAKVLEGLVVAVRHKIAQQPKTARFRPPSTNPDPTLLREIERHG